MGQLQSKKLKKIYMAELGEVSGDMFRSLTT